MSSKHTDVCDEKLNAISKEYKCIDIKGYPTRDDLEDLRLSLHKRRLRVRKALHKHVIPADWKQSIAVQEMIGQRIAEFRDKCKKFSIESISVESDLIDAFIYYLDRLLVALHDDRKALGKWIDYIEPKVIAHWLRFSYLDEQSVQCTNLWEILTSNREELIEYLTAINPGAWAKMELKCSRCGTCDLELLDIKVTPRGMRNEPVPSVTEPTLLETYPWLEAFEIFWPVGGYQWLINKIDRAE